MSRVADKIQNESTQKTASPKPISILGVPLGYGASMAGVDMGPAALRGARLNQRINNLGYSVRDLGDLRLDRPHVIPEPQDKLKYVNEIRSACAQLARNVEETMEDGEFPIILGGDHSIALRSFAGMSVYYRERTETPG